MGSCHSQLMDGCRKESSQADKCAMLVRTTPGEAICSYPGVEDSDSYASGNSVYEGEEVRAIMAVQRP